MNMQRIMEMMNNGNGIKILNMEGVKERKRLVRDEKKKRGIHHAKDCSEMDWYLSLEKELFSDKNEKSFWNYGNCVMCK